MARPPRPLAPALFALALALAAGCRPPAAPPEVPPPKVTVARPVQRSIARHSDFPGRIEAVEKVEVRARVKGFLKSVKFKEGAEVKKGDLLYEIDPRTFEADVAKAEGEVTRLKTQSELAASELERTRRLRSGSAVSEEEYQNRLSARETARASVASAEAALKSARLELGFTKIHAPQDGRVDRTLVTEGNLVGQSEATLLTTIVRMDVMYVYFDVPERDFLEYDRQAREEKLARAADARLPVFVGLQNEEGYPRKGVIDFRSNVVDPETGTVRVRGELPNADRSLTPGLFARVRVPIGAPRPRLLVPEPALQTDQRGQYVLIAREDNTVEYRPVTVGEAEAGMVIVEKGVGPDDRVIVNGVQRARPGATVAPEEAAKQ